MTTQVIEMPQTGMVEVKTSQLIARAQSLAIHSNADYLAAGDYLKSIAAVRREIGEAFDGPVTLAHKLHKQLLATKAKYDAPLAEAESKTKLAMGSWSAEQERQRCKEEARLRSEADERARKAAEDEQLEAALAAQRSGNVAAAEAIVSAPVAYEAPPVVVPRSVPRAEGIASLNLWKFRIIDAKLIPRDYMVPDQTKIGALVRALKAECRIPGIEVYTESTVSVRRG